MSKSILVTQGAEYNAVRQGCRLSKVSGLKVQAIPMGRKALQLYLETHPLPKGETVLLGLGGGLVPQLSIGEVVIYQDCVYQEQISACSSQLQAPLEGIFGKPIERVRGLSSDRLLANPVTKQSAHQLTGAQVVDLESFFLLARIPNLTIIRVISDDSEQSLPNLEAAISDSGELKSPQLALAMLQQPLPAWRLIQSSLKALRILTELTRCFCLT